MITLYQLHWSHYVEKVRWALDYKGLDWSAVDVDAFTKRQMHHLRCKLSLDSGRSLYTVPTIHDEATNAVVGDSSKILQYLERTYPTPSLYPEDVGECDEVTRWMLWLDSTLGLFARRLGYTQIALEHPGILASLFVPHIVGDRGCGSIRARIGGVIIAGVLSRRFRFPQNRADRVFDQLEECLLIAAERLSSRQYLVGDRFTAADLTLAALLRPVLLVPFFRDHPRLGRIWNWRARQLEEHHREQELPYQTALESVRQRRKWALGAVRWLACRARDDRHITAEIPSLPAALNDHQSVGRWPALFGPFWYVRLRLTCGLGRTVHP
ncbi:MAG: glutathione S-transferase family protein [Steroidobacteraceae bacterium]